jgi:hypothetical protein
VTPHWRLNGHLAVQRLSMHDLLDPGSDFERSIEAHRRAPSYVDRVPP